MYDNSVDSLKRVSINALQKTFMLHEELGEDGLQKVNKNQFGDTALRIDVDSEEIIIQEMKKANIPIRIVSEEHGTIDIVDNPVLLGILDGLDGTSVYEKSRGVGRYGTMFGIFSNLDPLYSDYLFSGIMEHSMNRLTYATRNMGGYVIQDGKQRKIQSSGKKVFENPINIYINDFFQINRELFSDKLKEYEHKYLASSAPYYADTACGDADITMECTRKGNLEIAISYGLEIECNAVMVSFEQQDLGKFKYWEFGQKENVPVITAATKELVSSLFKKIK